jgi:hypothetical protein
LAKEAAEGLPATRELKASPLRIQYPHGPIAPADGVGERLRRLPLSDVAVARIMDENPRPKSHCRSFPPFPMSSGSFPAVPGMGES